MTWIIVLIAVSCLAYANGANDNFKGVATLFGSGTTNYRGALIWATITTFLGSMTAVFLAEAAKHVHLLVRKDGLAETMSRYLVRRIEEHPAITLRTRTELVALDGDRHLDRVQWRDSRTGVVETHDVRHVFMMTGAVPNTGWLDGCVALDGRGFIKTGPDLSPEELTTAGWPLARPPYLLETNRPGVFAVGDVRGGNIKRVASAVGEGSIAVAFVHQVLHQ